MDTEGDGSGVELETEMMRQALRYAWSLRSER